MSVFRDPASWMTRIAAGVPADWGRAVPDQAFLVSPDGFRRADESARDNVYMADGGFDVDRALALTWHDFGGANLAAGHWQRARLGGVRAVAQDWRLLAGWKLLAKGLWRGLSSPGRSGATR